MHMSWKMLQTQRRRTVRRRWLGTWAAMLVLGALGFSLHISGGRPEPADSNTSPVLSARPPEPEHVFVRTIQTGDTLSSIFGRFNINQGTLHQILAADEALLALDVLRPGNVLTLTLDKQTRQLEEMELFIHAGSRVVYRRVNDSGFDFEEIIQPGIWEQELLEGEINGSFFVSATRAGLTDGETAAISDLFKDQLNFRREIKAGDRFQVVRKRQFVEGESTGQSRIEGVRILRPNRLYSAFLFEDGNYYDHRGESLVRAFMRYPTKSRHRVSSHFNPVRRHPVTRRIAPHNGVDFAMPIGTPVKAIGDGVVTRVHHHPFAGKYVEIQHGGQYVTRYLHLHKTLVRRGQRVQTGDRIALSGNTGRSTGPHLHFELHVNGRPVDPLRAKIPMSAAVPREKLPQFHQRVAVLVAMMEQPQGHVAAAEDTEESAGRI